jgi:hypothetical protein
VSKTPETLALERALFNYTAGQFGCDEVTIGPAGHERVDYITWSFDGTWRCYEIKVSKADFRSKARKTFVGHLNYYVMPATLYDAVKAEIPEHVGVLVPAGPVLVSKKKASRQPLKVDERKLIMSLMRSLFRVYNQVKRSGQEPAVAGYKREIAQLKHQLQKRNQDNNNRDMENWRMKHFLRTHGLMAEYEKEQEP